MGWLWWSLRAIRRSIAWVLVVVLLVTNVLTLTWSAASMAASAALGAVGVTTVAAREATRYASRRLAVRAAARQAMGRARGIAGRAVASLPGKYIPLVGVGVIATVTAWDVYDTCRLAQDLSALDDELEDDNAAVCGITLPDWAAPYVHGEKPPPL